MATTQLTGRQIKDHSIDVGVKVTGVLPPANGGKYQYILLQDQKNSGESGQTLSLNSWQKLHLNTVTYDDTSSVSISNNSFILPAGTYEVLSNFLNMSSNYNFQYSAAMRLYNETDTNAVMYGGHQGSYYYSACFLTLRGKFTVTAPKTFSLQVYTRSALIHTPASIPGVPEIYTQIELHKVV